MTEQEKSKIRSLRTEGYGYKKIALAVGISVNTVKMPKRKQRKFCSVQCREKWWNENRDKGNKPTGETLRCIHCGKAFSAYEREHRKYCSHTCYVAERFQGGDANA